MATPVSRQISRSQMAIGDMCIIFSENYKKVSSKRRRMLQAGERFHDLTVVCHCGGGAYGDVYYCSDISGKSLSLKVISKLRVGAEWQRELKGITNYRKLSEETSGLLRIYHVGEDDESFFYTMEPADAVAGKERYTPDTLARRLANGPLPQPELLTVLKTLLDDISTLHDAGFAHRDVKPDNVLFVGGRPKLADLGLLSPITGTYTQLAGTLDFLPPEQRTGEETDCHESRQQNDLYAFGKIIYCCVTGRGANEFPSLPDGFTLSLANKLLFRLSLRLCNSEKSLRMKELSQIQHEFAKISRILEHGEGAWERLRYNLSTAWLVVRETQRRGLMAARRHGFMAMLIFTLPAATAVALYKYLRGRPATESEELALALMENKAKAAEIVAKSGMISFFDGSYSMTVPSDWEAYDRDAIAQWLDSIERLRDKKEGEIAKVHPAMSNFIFDPPLSANGLYLFMIMPGRDGMEARSVVLARVLKLTESELEVTSEETQTSMFKNLVARRNEEVEAISLRRYTDRHGKDTVLFVGQTERCATVSYIFPQVSHTLSISAVMPKELFNGDMPKFLHLVDGVERNRPSE